MVNKAKYWILQHIGRANYRKFRQVNFRCNTFSLVLSLDRQSKEAEGKGEGKGGGKRGAKNEAQKIERLSIWKTCKQAAMRV